MTFRDQSAVLREQLEAAEKELAALRAKNQALAAGESPLVRRIAMALAAGCALGAGFSFHLLRRAQALEESVVAQGQTAVSLRTELDRTIEARDRAQATVLAEQAECRERAELASVRASSLRADAWRAGPSPPPTRSEPDRFFWLTSVRGRTELDPSIPCVVSLEQQPGRIPGQNDCGLAIRCGIEGEVEVLPRVGLECSARPDGWADADTYLGGIHVELNGPQIRVEDIAGGNGWTVALTNRRPCR